MSLEKLLREALVNFANSEDAKKVAEKNDKAAKDIDTIRETVDDNFPIMLAPIMFPEVFLSAIVWAVAEEKKSNIEKDKE